jgi:hypothetical protein
VKCVFRQPTEEDVDFIFNSWLQSYRKTELKMTHTVYYDKFKKILTAILEKALVLVACNEHEPRQVYGYIVYEPTEPLLIHWMYVKYVYRQQGLGGELLNKIRKNTDPIVCTFANYPFTKLKLKWRLTYNPWLR